MAAANSTNSFADRRASFSFHDNDIFLRLAVNPISLEYSGTRKVLFKLVVHQVSVDANNRIFDYNRSYEIAREIEYPNSAESSDVYEFRIIEGIVPDILNTIPHLRDLVGEAFQHHQQVFRSFAQEAIQVSFTESDIVRVQLIFTVTTHHHYYNHGTIESVVAHIADRSEDVPTPILEKLIRGKYRDVRGKYQEEDCPICLNKFTDDAEASRMPCLHVFHGDCLLQCLKRSHLCPLCRFDLANN